MFIRQIDATELTQREYIFLSFNIVAIIGILFSDDLSMLDDDSASLQRDKVLCGVCALTQAQIRVSNGITDSNLWSFVVGRP